MSFLLFFLELICYLSESLRNMEKEVPEERTFDPRYQHVPDEEMDISGYDLDVTTYDESNLSLEQLQELFLATQGIPESSLNQHHHQRPHLVTKKKKLLWTSKRVEDLKLSSELAMQKFKCNKKSRYILHIFKKKFVKIHENLNFFL